MKKILLALTLIAMLVCVFALTVYAEDRTSISYTDINGVTHDVPVVKYEDATAQSVATALGNNSSVQERFIDNGAYVILMATDGTLTAYPTWYIIEPSGSSSTYVAISEVEYAYVNAMSGKTYEKGAVRYVEFPNTLTAVRNNGVFGNKNNAQCYEINVTDVYIPSSVTSLESAFNSAKSLKNVYIEAGNGITAVPSGTFSSSTVQYVQFENLTELQSIDGFTKCAISGDIDLSKTKLKTIANGAFQNSTNIKKITLPDTVEKIDDYAFESIGSGYLASPYLPSSLTYVGQRFFAYNDNLLDTYIFPVGVQQLKNEPFQDSKVAGGPSGKKLDLIFLGEVTGVVYLNGNGHQKHAEEVTVYFAKNSRDQYNSNGFYIKPSGSSLTSVPQAIRAVFCKGTGAGTNGNVTGVEYIYITNTNGSAYTEDMVNDSENGFDYDNHTHYGAHTYEANTCAKDGYEAVLCIVCDKEITTVLEATGKHNYVAGVCTVCGKSYCTSGSDHTLKLDAIYENGFMNAGIIANKCQSEGCTYYEKLEDAEALFNCSGYSAPEYGADGIAIGFTVNNAAIAEYEATGKTLKYGVFAVLKDKLGTNDVFGGNGEAADGVISAEITNYSFVAFDLKVIGFTDTQKDTKLAMGAYVAVTNGETTEY
ncbi:MAG: leucine-rich repeat domain-containing protein, partial [Clostridia bacterium]|nr:leucine-rich repeat domain-containing protein [Clostridia bacterium]